jgi:hypothetical protein
MKTLSTKHLLLAVVAAALIFAIQTTADAQNLPKPVLAFVGQEYVTVAGKQVTRYHFDVANKDDYPADLFEASPSLPPCGTNTKASRTWVDFYDHHGKRLNGFCALSKPGDLSKIWFALDQEEVPPSWVYIEFNDRKTNTKYKSNLAETTM